jgi:hypothetical protein
MDEESYTIEINDIINKWKSESIELSKKHEELSHHYYKKFIIYNSIILITPFILTFISQIEIEPEINKYVNGSAFLLIGVSNAIVNFLGFKSKSDNHEFASFNYKNLTDTIDSNFSRNEKFRVPADVMITQVRTEIKNLDLFSPRMGESCLSDICLKRKI